MAKNINTGDKNLAKVEGALTKSEQFIEKNQKNLTRIFVITLAYAFEARSTDKRERRRLFPLY